MANEAKVTVPATNVQVIDCKAISIQVFGNADSNIRYRMKLDVSIDAMKKNYTTEEYELAQVDYIDFVPRVLVAQVINLVEGVDIMYSKKKERGIRNDNGNEFGSAELQVILRGAKLKIERTKFEVGSEYTDGEGVVHTHENAGYNTNIVDIKVTDRIQAKLDDIVDSMFNF